MNYRNSAAENQPPENRPGLPALSYRVGDYNTFFRRMVKQLPTALSSPDDPGKGGPLAPLTTRVLNDPAIALLDAWAVVADVLTFYQERIANEGYLLTATERLSVLQLSRMIGYELSPGVAASTQLAFFVEDDPQEPGIALVPKGTQIMSVPEGDEKPQVFETSESFVARALWNAMKPRPSRPQKMVPGLLDLHITGDAPDLSAGDRLLLIEAVEGSDRRYLLTIERTTKIPDSENLQITLKAPLSFNKPLQQPQLFAFRQEAHLFGYNAPRWQDVPDEIKRTAVEEYVEAQKVEQESSSTPADPETESVLLEGGVLSGSFITSEGSYRWTPHPVGEELPNKDILSLAHVSATTGNFLIAGTAGQGILRLKQGTEDAVWKPVNTGLTNLNVNVLYLDSQNHLLAGTTAGGVFRSKDIGDTWTPIHLGSVSVESQDENNWKSVNTGLPMTVVRSMVAYATTSSTGKGRLVSIPDEFKRIRGINTEFTKELTEDSSITLSMLNGDNEIVEETFNVEEIISDVELKIQSAYTGSILNASFEFSPPVESSYLFVGTDDGIYRTQNQGKDWSPITDLSTAVIYALEVLSPDDAPLIIAATDQGLYQSDDNGVTWTLVQASFDQVKVRSLATIDNTRFFAGTETAVFELERTTATDPWQSTSLNLNRVIQTLAIGEGNRLIAGTPNGIFVSSPGPAEPWSPAPSNAETVGELGAVDFVSLAIHDDKVFAGSRFEGFNEKEIHNINTAASDETANVAQAGVESSNTVATSIETIDNRAPVGGEWLNFRLREPQQIDLDTRYPQLRVDSWIVLLNDKNRDTQQQPIIRQVKQLFSGQRRDFTLDEKVTTVEPDFPIEPSAFDLRTTTVLIQSEAIELAKDPLTVEARQHEIFLDPIQDKTVILEKYVADLEPGKQLIVSGKPIRASLQNVGGVFYSATEGQYWHRRNQGLTHTGIQALVLSRFQIESITGTSAAHAARPFRYVLAGTQEGVFRSSDRGQTWEPINQGLANLNITALETDESTLLQPTASPLTTERLSNSSPTTDASKIKTRFPLVHKLKRGDFVQIGNRLRQIQAVASNTEFVLQGESAISADVKLTRFFAGTVKGVFYSTNYGETWRDLSDGLTIPHVLTLLTLENEDNVGITIEDTQLLAGTLGGGIFRLTGRSKNWLPAGLTHFSVQALATKSFDKSTPFAERTLFAGTLSRGLYRSNNGGRSWKNLKDTIEGIGTLSSHDATITGQNTQLAGQLKIGSRITASGQIRTVINIISNTELSVDQAFQPDLKPGTSFTASTGLTNLNITALAIHRTYDESEIATDYLFAGTAGSGIFVSVDEGEFWTQVNGVTPNGDLKDLEIRCLTVQTETGLLFAGTASGGVFKSDDLGAHWEAVNQGIGNAHLDASVMNLDVRAIATDSADSALSDSALLPTPALFAGGIGMLKTAVGIPNAELQLNDSVRIMRPPTPLTTSAKEHELVPFESVAALPDSGQRLIAIAPTAPSTTTPTIATTAASDSDTYHIRIFDTDGARAINQPLSVFLPNVQLLDRLKTFFAQGQLTPEAEGRLLEQVAMTVGYPLSTQAQLWHLRDRNNVDGYLIASAQDLHLQPALESDPLISETHQLQDPLQEQQYPKLTLTQPIQNSYDPATVSVHANVTAATHGETETEILGSGSGIQTHQRFSLGKPPLTYTSAATASGRASSLEVRVNDVLWEEARSLYELDSQDQKYIVRIDDDGTPNVIFGDGDHGARLPSGQENIQAVYRSGIGQDGNLPAERLTILKTRPLGVTDVTNPVWATGGADPEAREDAAEKAPASVRTLDRIVSLQDFEDFSRAFAGIGKAQSVAVWNGADQIVHITVAATNGDGILPDSALYANLVKGIDAARDTIQQVQIASFIPLLFNLAAQIRLDPRYLLEQVEAQIRQQLAVQFTFIHRDFGQPVTAAEVVSAIQGIPGVIAVDLDALYLLGTSKQLNQTLLAKTAQWNAQSRKISPAQLLLINLSGIEIALK